MAQIIDYPRGMEEQEDTAPHGVEEQENAAPHGVEEQEDTAPHGVEEQSNIPRGIGIVLGMVGLLAMVVAGLVVFGYFGPVSEAWRPGQSNAKFAITLDAAGIDAELARLHGLPGETLPANLGTIAKGKTACIVALMAGKPSAKAKAAATRLFVVLLAVSERTESPLIDPRFYQFSNSDTEGLERLIQLVDTETFIKSDTERLAKLVQEYGAAAHPIYSGLEFEAGGWAYTDFEQIAAVGGGNAERVSACVRARVGG